jgi:hypothetical protein
MQFVVVSRVLGLGYTELLSANLAPEKIAVMSEQVSIQDLDGKRISGRYAIKDGVVTVTAADGRTMRGVIEDSMLTPETLAKTLLFQLHRPATDDQ